MKVTSIQLLSLFFVVMPCLVSPAWGYEVRTISQTNAAIVYEIAMTADEQSFVDQEGLLITVAKLQDSRCPVDKHCFWAGNVNLNAIITNAEEVQYPVDLTLQAGKNAAWQKFHDQFLISLVDVGAKSVDNQSPWIHFHLVKNLESKAESR